MKDRARDLSKRAREMRDKGQLVSAGNIYTASCHEYAGEVEEHLFPAVDGTDSALSQLLSAATCYRVAGDSFRVENRCEMGILLARDYIEFIEGREFERSFYRLQYGGWYEFIGDFCVIVERHDEAVDWYDRTQKFYEDANASEWEFVMAEDQHVKLANFFADVRRGFEGEIPENSIENRPLGPTFLEWLDYKRERLPDLLSELEEKGEWPVDGGENTDDDRQKG